MEQTENTTIQLSIQDLQKLVKKEVEKSFHQILGIVQNPKDKFAYSPDEIAMLLGLSKGFVRKEIKAGNLKIARFGARVVVLNEDFQNYLRSGIAVSD